MRRATILLFLALILPAAALSPGKVVFQNAYPEKGGESSYNLKTTFTYGVDDEINCRCYYGGHTLEEWIDYAHELHPGAQYSGYFHIVNLTLDPKADWPHDDNQWWTEVTDPSLDWDQCGGYSLLPNEFGDDIYGFETDLNSYGAEGAHGTHTVEYKVVIELVDDWDPLRGEYMWQTDVTVAEGSFKWIVP
ncbi:MAG: hypothetical protein A2Y64_08325 [Candidatus Coatesbacteria bacterium RBG_13_66_14]|uniref:Uncharacterized protein n=1 Tax=Candidatus Coatesbacteria bacterium RBG_13_66_14 TaxID=1817816 RepID=A0A1F5EWS7_9BACT|nr:MAG: hypothetical protein A2Y64_08325 [Candidatus Coatesbacteria bacterium RBG_13_66_14]